MRGAVSGGMVLALHELGLAPVFDAAYGSSAGALGSAWRLSGSAPAGLATYLDRGIVERIVSPRRALAGSPAVDMDHLLGVVYEQIAPGFFERLASHPVRPALSGAGRSRPAIDPWPGWERAGRRHPR